jgi:hypothetical protein
MPRGGTALWQPEYFEWVAMLDQLSQLCICQVGFVGVHLINLIRTFDWGFLATIKRNYPDWSTWPKPDVTLYGWSYCTMLSTTVHVAGTVLLHTPFCRSYWTYNMLVQVSHTGRVERREQFTQVGLTARHHRHTRRPGCMTHSYARYQQNMYSSTCNTVLLLLVKCT